MEAMKRHGHRAPGQSTCIRSTGPNVIVPGGWDKLKKGYNIDGYGLFLIDGDGRLLGRELFPDDIEGILKERGN
jgi:hypothetical protein